MKYLLPGIVDFKTRVLPSLGENIFKNLAAKQQHAESLFIGCSDSRMVPNLFASTNPGELFVVRNVGNIVPCCSGHDGKTNNELHESVGAAIDFSNFILKVKDIIVCGHSECGAVSALHDGIPTDWSIDRPHLYKWLQQGLDSSKKFQDYKNNAHEFISPLTQKKVTATFDNTLSSKNIFSQIHTLQQTQNLITYKGVKDRVTKGELQVHAWWFDIGTASVYSFSEKKEKFVLIDEEKAIELLERKGISTETIKELLNKKGEIPAWVIGELKHQSPK